MAKTINAVVGVVVASAAVPAFQPRVGTQLNHAKRGGGTRIGVTVAACANEGIDFKVQRTVLAGTRCSEDAECEEGEAKGCRHGHEFIAVCRRCNPFGCEGQSATQRVWPER